MGFLRLYGRVLWLLGSDRSMAVGLGIAAELSLDPVLILALVGTCISLTFLNPFSHQSNLMVMGPGGYSFATFTRFGIPLYLASIVVACTVGYVLLGT